MTRTGAVVQPLMSELLLDREGPTVVAVGGGHGLAQALLAIQQYAGGITAVVSVADDGGSSGRLVPAMDIPPPGDIRRCLIALSPEWSVWRDVFAFRFEEGDVAGHSLGNLVLAAFTQLSGDFEQALRRSERLLGTTGSVVPAAPRALQLQAVIDGDVVEGQVAIAQARGRLTELRLLPEEVKATESALEAIGAADQIVVGPGSLFTSLVATLVVPGIVEAANASDAQLVYVCNLTTQDGETLGMDGLAHVEALVKHAGLRVPDVVVAQRTEVEAPPPVEAVKADSDRIEALGARVVLADVGDHDAAWPQHDPVRLGTALRSLD
ncbi:MAG: uridine diphosphate-N-acetylglucosamine-binding protein YvcK [Acidimicrobiia bacterium]